MSDPRRRLPRTPEEIREMFGRVAPYYDTLNHVLSAGADVVWRKRAAAWASALYPHRVLDLAAGTGDMAVALAERCPQARIAALDFSPEMLELCERKLGRRRPRPRVSLLAAEVLSLPFPGDVFDVVSIAFCLRNLQDPVAALREGARVLRPGGWLLALEITWPEKGVRMWPFRLYLRHLVPLIGAAVSRDAVAYRYLRDSVIRFSRGWKMTELVTGAGLSLIRAESWSGGIASCVLAKKPGQTSLAAEEA